MDYIADLGSIICKCNRLHYNYFVNVIDYITDYIWDHDNQCIFKFAMKIWNKNTGPDFKQK